MKITSLLTLCGSVALATSSNAGLVAHWNMNETSGNIADSSGNGLTGALQTAGSGAVYGTASVAAGTYGAITVSASQAAAFGTAIDFGSNGNNRSNYSIGGPSVIGDLATAQPGGNNGTGTFTAMAWINLDSTAGGSQQIFATGNPNGWGFSTNGGNLRFTTFNSADNDIAAGLTAGTWTHVAITYNNNSAEFFVNGVSVGTDTSLGDFREETTGDFRVGALSGGGNQFFGDLDEVKIFDNVLTQSEIQAAAVPEPSSTALLGLGGLALILRRRK